ncbi:arabinan endo-1,5-alpha-L-arabinosidase [Allosphingosinicella deserti]|uniref:Extracellular exo-alpha-(1->5)-L-arabinofuranosidase n=1 Tax=Allosphingosinicella deserti TaxID=2116704 RepID=A0A2P7QRS9_9SPHN|nr:arabinan endo-1,5-alpha-L-arabinosidase [Sphingomonas deserti]PSJ40676.1 arabinan endo-1,5-alpha-L-arabinosidase [Sphingomonas deserti]
MRRRSRGRGGFGRLFTVVAITQAAGCALSPQLRHTAAVQGDVVPVHDPAIIRAGNLYHLFATGHLSQKTGMLPWRTSEDLVHWRFRGAAFPELPGWTGETVPGARGLWAPDIIRVGGEYRLYYSVSTFGKNQSAIGLATAARLDPEMPSAWTDKGPVIASTGADDFNAIDPNAFVDRDGRQWLVFGSFWSGLKLVELDPATGLRKFGAAPVSLARRPVPGAIEAPFLIRRGGFYYLFASFDFCCRKLDSSYYTVVGRARTVQGPYADRSGRTMLDGGGSVVLHADLEPEGRWRGPGHVAILRGRPDRIVFHAYDAHNEGASTLQVRALDWTRDGWPVVRDYSKDIPLIP